MKPNLSEERECIKSRLLKMLKWSARFFFTDRHDYTNMFSRNFRLSAGGPSADHEISTSVDKLMPRRMIPPQKSGLKSGSLSTASSAHGVPRGRRLWPGNSVPRRMGNVTRGRRARGPSPGSGESTREPFLFGPTTAHESVGPHGAGSFSRRH